MHIECWRILLITNLYTNRHETVGMNEQKCGTGNESRCVNTTSNMDIAVLNDVYFLAAQSIIRYDLTDLRASHDVYT